MGPAVLRMLRRLKVCTTILHSNGAIRLKDDTYSKDVNGSPISFLLGGGTVPAGVAAVVFKEEEKEESNDINSL
ncbi:hypothetical protein L1987_48757 [Smallanthus sonchifolius]|uniref:Uncharacterized protein n=1 Tax=Smallanthus sonchifolius TaxID=185202 RepID=A0ACB9FSM5_9ASTR|nr:hypothetical protein L1987_48757 [Smallanthus sonchifolius]